MNNNPEVTPAENPVETPVEVPAETAAPAPEPTPVPNPTPAPAPAPVSATTIINNNLNTQPFGRLNTNRGMLKLIFLGIITLGIYPLVIWSGISTDINIIAHRYDGRRTMHYMVMQFFIFPITLGIASYVWSHNLCSRIGFELRRRKIAYNFSAATFWLWNILGVLIIVGPFVYLHKICKAMNLLSQSYNTQG